MVKFEQLKKTLCYAATNSGFYKRIFANAGIDALSVENMDDFRRLPFSDKYDLREEYPLGIQAAPDERIVRIHSSSGTTGKAIIIPYT
ncbi:MAG: phenylacetate--CoA ligase family protein, partial [Eubacteriales bacterium]